MHIVNTLGPVFLIIALGAVLRQRGFLTAEAVGVITRACYWIGLPALLLVKIALATPPPGAAAAATHILVLGTLVMLALGLLAARLLGLHRGQVGAFLQASFRGNLAFVGLPVVIFAYTDGPHAEAAEAVASLALGPTIVLFNVLSVLALLLSTHHLDRASIKRMLLKLAGNPLLIACLAGMLWNRFLLPREILFPATVERTLRLLGDFTLPMALMSVGSALVSTPFRGALRTTSTAALLKTAIAPAVGFLLAHLMGAGPLETGVAVILLAAPTAVASYVLAEQLGGDSAISAGSVVVSTVISIVTLSAVIACL